MLNKVLIREKIGLIRGYFQEIKEIIKLDTKEILEDIRNLRTLERDFQLIVHEMIDINLHFIQELELKSSPNFQSTFEALVEGKILPMDFALKIAPVVGLRNRLIHRYQKIDKKFFVKQVKKECQDFIEYIKYINQYREKIKNEDILRPK